MTDLMTRPIRTELSERNLRFEPGSQPTTFEVVVHNESDRFASFQVEVEAPGVDPGRGADWYRLSPSVSSKIPEGDNTRFWIEIFGIPPVSGGFSGVMRLTVKTYSPELDEDDRQDVKLTIEGDNLAPPQLQIQGPNPILVKPKSDEGNASEPVSIEVLVQNPNRKPLTTTLTIEGVDPAWRIDGAQRALILEPNKTQSVTLRLRVPVRSMSRDYPVTIVARQANAPEAAAQVLLRLLPTGFVQFRVEPPGQQLPPHSSEGKRWLNPRIATATFLLHLDNHSNSQPIGSVVLDGNQADRVPTQTWFQQLWQPLRGKLNRDLQRDKRLQPLVGLSGGQTLNSSPTSSLTSSSTRSPRGMSGSPTGSIPGSENQPLAPGLTLVPRQIQLASAEPIGSIAPTPNPLTLTVERTLPWLGWPRIERLDATAHLLESDLEIRDPVQSLELQVLTVVPVWLQWVGGLLLLALLATLWALRSPGHRGPVTSVRFNGQATEIISSSTDQTLRAWDVKDNGLSYRGLLIQLNRAIRTVRYRPINNDQLGLALENGEVKGLNLLSGAVQNFTGAQDDRAFDLVFLRDSRTLFTGHGSGLIQGHLFDGPGGVALPQSIDAKFAIRALAVVGEDDRYLAIAGRYNQLKLLDLQSIDRQPGNRNAGATSGVPVRSLPYNSGGSEAYIMGLARAESQPNRLAVADNQGQISLWDVGQCLAPLVAPRSDASGSTTTPITGSEPIARSAIIGDCKPIESWPGHGGAAVNAVALSGDGCYLASAGDDGKVRLWPLTKRGTRRSEQVNGQVLSQSRQRFNSVDLIRRRDRLLIASGGDDHRVRLDSVAIDRSERDCSP
jgi:WD40 repeat protein